MTKLKIAALLFGVLLVFQCNEKSPLINEQSLPKPDAYTMAYASLEDRQGWNIHIRYKEGNSYNVSKTSSFDVQPNWSPDKKRIAFCRGNDEFNYLQIWIMNYDGSNKRKITPDGMDCQIPRWSLDGKRILFTGRYLEENFRNIYSIKPDGSNLELITKPEIEYPFPMKTFSFPDWSPDASSVIFAYIRADTNAFVSGIGIINLDQNKFKIINGIQHLRPYNPRWSPNSNEILFNGIEEDSQYIYMIEANGNNLHKVGNISGGEQCWTRDANEIFFVHVKVYSDSLFKKTIWRMNKDGSNSHIFLEKELSVGLPAL